MLEPFRFPHAAFRSNTHSWLEPNLTDNSKLVAALFDTNCECRRVELLYQHGQEQFSLISGNRYELNSSESLDIASARSWVAQHPDKVTVVADF
jgi:hypothetical protein